MTNALTIKEVFKEKIPEYVSKRLQSSEVQIVAASIVVEDNPRVSQMSSEDFDQFITLITHKTALRLGTKAKEEDDQEALNMELNRDLLKFHYLTQKEILRALENGLDGMYTPKGQPVIFSPSAFVQWIRAYIEETKRPVMKKISELQKQVPALPEPELTEEEKIWKSYYFLEWVVDITLQGSQYIDVGQLVYRFLEKMGCIDLTDEQKWEWMEKAKAKMMIEALDGNDRNRLRSIKKLVDESPVGVRNESIAVVAMRMIVSDKLYMITKDGIDDAADFLDDVKEKVKEHVAELNQETA